MFKHLILYYVTFFLANKLSLIAYHPFHFCTAVWPTGNVVGGINKVTQRLPRLVLGWVTVAGRAHQLAMRDGSSPHLRGFEPATL